MSRNHAIWLLLSFALAVGMNRLARPHAPYELSEGERTSITGTLWLDVGGKRQEFKLVTVRLVNEKLPRLFADPLPVRVLWLRSPEQDGAPPDLELFAELDADPAAAVATRDLAPLRARELPILAQATAGDARSRVRFRGGDAASQVGDGQLIIDEAFVLGESAQGFRVQGRVRLSLDDGEPSRLIVGEFNARLVPN